MRMRSFIIAYALVLAILLFADRRPSSRQQDRYSHVLDLTDGESTVSPYVAARESRTHIIAPGALIPGTWAAGQIPAERLVAPLVVIDLKPAIEGQRISLDDIAAWESQNGIIPQGAVVAIRRPGATTVANHGATNHGAAGHGAVNQGAVTDPSTDSLSIHGMSARNGILATQLPLDRDAAQFLIEARYTIGFAVETPVNFTSDHTLARQLALRGTYVVEGAARFSSLPVTGSLVIVAPAKNKTPGEVPVRILAMVR
jgi:kynurenine formamidase